MSDSVRPFWLVIRVANKNNRIDPLNTAADNRYGSSGRLGIREPRLTIEVSVEPNPHGSCYAWNGLPCQRLAVDSTDPFTLIIELLNFEPIDLLKEYSIRQFVSDIEIGGDAIISNGMPPADLLGYATAIYGNRFNPMITLKALTWFKDGDVSTLPQSTRDRLIQAVELRFEISTFARTADRIAFAEP